MTVINGSKVDEANLFESGNKLYTVKEQNGALDVRYIYTDKDTGQLGYSRAGIHIAASDVIELLDKIITVMGLPVCIMPDTFEDDQQ